MTEEQQVQAAEPTQQPEAQQPASEQPEPTMSSRRVTVGDRSWTVVDLHDGLSWNVHRDGEQGPRLGHVRISERGYFSNDPAGIVRGPYTTLDEAVYPLGLDDPVLLDGLADRADIEPPRPSVSRQRRSSAAWLGGPRIIGVTFTVLGVAFLLLRRPRGREAAVAARRGHLCRVRPLVTRP